MSTYGAPHKGVDHDPRVGAHVSHPTEHVVPQVELRVSCKQLASTDTFSGSDPFCVLERKTLDNRWAEAGRTERISNCADPKFVTPFRVDYHFEERQEMRFSLYDSDSSSHDLSKHDFLGSFYCCLGELMVSAGQAMSGKLCDSANPTLARGSITVEGEEVAGANLHVSCQLRGERLDNKDFFSKSDPYVIIHRSRESGGYAPVYRSEVISNNLNPVWHPIEKSATDLAGGDLDRPLLIECFDYDKTSKDDLIGNALTSLRALSEGRPVELSNPKKVGKKGYQNSGLIHPVRCQITQVPSFLDFIVGGCEMNLMVAIDFTASNKVPTDPSSLHFHSAGAPNEYQRAISAVGQILLDYDSDGKVAAYGFGARLPPGNQVSHAFALNGQPQDPFVDGVDGILAAYETALSSVTLYGPTIFSQIIRLAASQATGVSQHNQRYTTLLILTDGAITDVGETASQIIQASGLPISIVIVGVGQADFGNMDRLDGDGGLSSGGRSAKRDIVQFVPFRQFAHLDPSYLAKEVLKEIPEQMLSFFRTAGIRPNAPRQAAVPGGGVPHGAPHGAPPPPPPQYVTPPPPGHHPQHQQGHPGHPPLMHMGSSGNMMVPPHPPHGGGMPVVHHGHGHPGMHHPHGQPRHH
jgi:hypothetical protein